MAIEPKPNASSVCYLDEADNIYRGYADIDEIRQLIQRWIKQSPSPAIGQAMAMLLPSEHVLPASGDTAVNRAAIGDAEISDILSSAMLRDEIRRLLPRIGDDGMHAKLKSIADTLN
jgi:hypothetical protein